MRDLVGHDETGQQGADRRAEVLAGAEARVGPLVGDLALADSSGRGGGGPDPRQSQEARVKVDIREKMRNTSGGPVGLRKFFQE